ncbi:MAG: polysaccharide pyruvyl transferase family protein [Lachnospiraceae bacterium]|nr:polysaccharide pyruvyl transferase family protein [Lachnospiraceae bacterium]
MKIAIITRHAITNYGSLLQAFATQKVIENLGHSCEIIDYIRFDELYSQHEKTLLKHKKEWNSNLVKKFIYLMLRQPESIAAGRRFEKEQHRYLNLTRRYNDPEELKKDTPIADVYMTGSDQVWGPIENGEYDDSYCLSFVKDESKKIAYAASFGRTEITSKLKDYYKKWLCRYQYIAVREDSAVHILEDIGIHAYQVLDPTLLMTINEWKKYMEPIKHSKYVLVYQLHNDKKLGKYAQKVAEAKRLPLVRISSSFHQFTREGKFVWCPTAGQFLSYIKNADCMITDSFHGTAFAINFNTPFVEVLPNNNTGTRNMSILKLLGLSDQVLKDDDNLTLAFKEIDFTIPNYKLEQYRAESIRILKKMTEA